MTPPPPPAVGTDAPARPGRRRDPSRDGEILSAALDVLAWCCRTAPKARADVKRTMDQFYGHYDRMAMDASLQGEEPVEGFLAFKERRNPSWVPPELRTDGRI